MVVGFPTSRDHPLTWRAGWSRTYVAPHHPFEQPKPRNHGISWGILRIAGEFVNQRGWCSRLWLRYFLSTQDNGYRRHVGYPSHCSGLRSHASVHVTNLRSLCKYMFFFDSIGHEFCDMVAETLHVCKIEHSPTPSLIPKPPRRCLKVWLCPPTVPLRHRPRPSTAPHRAPHPASLLPPSRGLPSGPRQPPVSAGSPPGPFPARPPCLRI